MNGYENAEPRLRCVLPFEAEPAELRAVRAVVREQLALWGMPGLADEALLAVTELATNVIKHVGEGTVATLVLERNEYRLRVELHDKSHTVPSAMLPVCDEECGRGLHLLAAMATDWGTVLTASGKAVWCEFSIKAGSLCSRVQRASAVLDVYRSMTNGPALVGNRRGRAMEESVTDLIADVLHWLAAQGGDPDDILDRAQIHFEAEAA
ncbi:ATP-binding protein [Streptomyces sp. SYSU K217416]